MLKNNGFIFIIHFFVSNHKDIKKRNSFLFVLKIKSMIINSRLFMGVRKFFNCFCFSANSQSTMHDEFQNRIPIPRNAACIFRG